MAQHDYNLADQAGAAFRLDINNVLLALATQNMGGTAPSVTFPMMPWADTTTSKLKIRSTDNTAWVVVGDLDVTNFGFAGLDSPAFVGTPTAPTPESTNNSSRVATTAMVHSLISSAIAAITTTPVSMDGTTAKRTITISDSAPTGGADGDIWFEY